MKPGQSSQLVSIILLLLVLVGTFVFVLPLRAKVLELKVQRSLATEELSVLDAEYNSLSALSLEVAKSDATKQALLSAVPVGTAQDELILELSKIANESGFDLNAVNFSEGVDENYGKFLTTTLNVSGGGDKLIAFLQQIESAQRLMRVKSMSLQKTSEKAVSFNLSIEAYYQ
ncbi:MAG: type 4a pilus biogenesis protein PilO [Candidatus Gracilibacteria bacterium]